MNKVINWRLIHSGRLPVLRNLKDGEVIRPVSVNRNTIKNPGKA